MRGREFWLALLLALAFGALATREGLFDPSKILLGVDTATVQLPWSKAIERDDAAPRNPGLADHGMVFYPAYRFVNASWRDGDPPLWNPWICAGAPGVGNPQLGALDPQVLALGVLERAGGERLYAFGFALLAALRFAAAALGAYLLARKLGLTVVGGAIAAASFASSGFVVVWIGASLGHVAFVLPWLLLALEGVRGSRPWLAVAAAASVLALAIYGGHPETAFYVGATGAAWALALFARERAAGLRALVALAAGASLGAASLVPFVEYLELSGAKVAREALPRPEPSWPALAGLLVVAAIVARFVRARSVRNEVECEPNCGVATWEKPVRYAAAAAVALAILALIAWLARDALAPAARLLVMHDALGGPGRGGWRGGGHFLEEASAWVPFATLALAASGLLSPRVALAPRLARRPWIVGGAVIALLLALRVPGVVDLHRHVPTIGLGATVRAAVVSALFLGLLAGEAFDASTRAARFAATIVLVGAVAFATWPVGATPHAARADASDEWVTFSARPPAKVDGGTVALEGWIARGVPVVTARVRVERIDEAAQALVAPAELADRAWSDQDASAAPADARFFRASLLDASYLPAGAWRFTLELVDERGATLGSRVAGETRVERVPRPSALSWLFALGSIAALLAPLRGTPRATLWILLVAAQGFDFQRGKNPAVPLDECFPPTRTVAILARELGSARYFADPGVMPANTGMIDGLASLDGYDSMDVATFDAIRQLSLAPGEHPLLGFHARGADLDSPIFRMFGVRMLALAEPLEHPGWELIAGPAPEDPEYAETFLYRARSPLPRAFCVARTKTLDQASADLDAFDPATEAILMPGTTWSADAPFERSRVEERERSNNAVRLWVELDGDGLLVATDQHFPGWTVAVDGEPRELLCVDAIFRGVALEAGEHVVEFRYEPASFRWGVVISCAALAIVVGCAALGLLRRRAGVAA